MPGAEACRSPGGQDTRKANPCPLGTSLEMPAPRGRPHGRAPGRDCGGDLTLWQGSRIRRWRLGLKALGRSSEEALQTQLGKPRPSGAGSAKPQEAPVVSIKGH